ncbi:MAG: DUF2336 domain-containing protein [Xanthobacteraceae bacterium]
MSADAPLLAALEGIVKHGSQDRRAEMLDRITDLFIGSAASFSEEHLHLFDEVFNRLVVEIEAKARFELSNKLAGINNAPLGVVRRLAEDDDILVARPVLERSERLAEPDLLNLAKTKSQLHLLAISNRNRIAEAITDVLVRRGDREVVRNVAGNSGARLSQTGFSTLVRKAEMDGILAEKVGQRSDIPQPFFHQLFIQATQIVQKRLLATATPEMRDKIRHVLAEISEQFTHDTMATEDFAALERHDHIEHDTKLDEAAIAELANGGHYDETMEALSTLCKIPLQHMHRILANKRADPALVVCKALGFAWPTARTIILLLTKGHGTSAHTLEGKHRNFEKLSASGSQEVLRLWYKRQGNQADIEGQLPARV